METILSRYLGDEYIINPIEPETVVENGVRKQISGGGWSRVLAHCNEQKFADILQLNDYLVVQIDSDACTQYGVPLLDSNNKKKTPDLLYPEIISRLCETLSEPFLQEFKGRIIFAICFDEIECWLLPLFYSNETRCRTNNCIYSLNKILSKNNLPCIPSDDNKNSPSAIKAYREILKTIKKKKTVEDISVFNYGFRQLVASLQLL